MTTIAPPRRYTTAEVCRLANITYKQADHWVRNAWLRPDQGDGSGHYRNWSEHEAIKAVAMARMVRAGISHAKAAELVAACLTATLTVTPLPEVLP